MKPTLGVFRRRFRLGAPRVEMAGAGKSGRELSVTQAESDLACPARERERGKLAQRVRRSSSECLGYQSPEWLRFAEAFRTICLLSNREVGALFEMVRFFYEERHEASDLLTCP